MAESTGETAENVIFRVAPVPASGAPAYLEVGPVTSVSVQGIERETVDFTHLRSTGGTREIRPGFANAGSITLNVQFNPAEEGQQFLRTAFAAKQKILWQIDLTELAASTPDLGEDFNVLINGGGFVTNPGDMSFEVNTPMAGTVTISITGPVTIDAAP